jgi:hypothetical protein
MEECAGGGGAGSGGLFRRFTAVTRQFFHDVLQVHRFVAAVRGHRPDRARQQIRRVGFDHQAIGRNVLDDLAQMATAALVA